MTQSCMFYLLHGILPSFIQFHFCSVIFQRKDVLCEQVNQAFTRDWTSCHSPFHNLRDCLALNYEQ